MWNKFVYVLNYLKLLGQCPKAIHGRTHPNKIKKPCWRQLTVSKSLLPYGFRDNNRASFNFVCQKECFQYKTEKVQNTTIEFWIFESV